MNTENQKEKQIKTRTPSFGVSLIPLIAMGLLLGVGYGVYKIRPQVLLVAAATIGVIVRMPVIKITMNTIF